ncbi:DUF2147 domain-containing protein [Ruegeria meonggei]|uniref:DUF2147 domain-containing protein n=1 Tax=Ruegeria meonggei TaxID=1446476 RepID=A0A1X6ZWZ4_9RHOB|nr:DUF2147 domain-containing protein [Ruegeria meonggei]SLN64078.1 hypothetical protein RUM8411_03191 [Ruegeria meonggei]
MNIKVAGAKCPSLVKGLHVTIAAIMVSACTSQNQDAEIVTRTLSPLEGYWRLDDKASIVFIEPCMGQSNKLCGRLVTFEGNSNALDTLNPGILNWGQKICNSTIVTDLAPADKEPDTHTGYLYDPEMGQSVNLIFSVKSPNQLAARAYHGSSVNEAINLVVSSALTGSVPIFETASLATRASIGKDHLGEDSTWTRVNKPERLCDTQI